MRTHAWNQYFHSLGQGDAESLFSYSVKSHYSRSRGCVSIYRFHLASGFFASH